MNLEDRVGFQDEAAAALFAAARAYRPARSARRRALRALGLPVGISLLVSSAAQGAMALLSAKGVVVLAVVAVAGAGAVAVGGAARFGAQGQRGGAKAVRGALAAADREADWAASGVRAGFAAASTNASTSTSTSASTNASASANTTTTRFAARSMSRSTVMPRARSLAGVGEGVVARRVVAMQGPVPLVLQPPPMEEQVSALQAQLRLIGAARGALRAGDSGGALRALDEHARRFPAGALAEEVALLRMRALLAAGEGAGARAVGESFLARRPHSPLAGAVRALLGFPNPSGQQGDRR
jgi:hypothetical protein